MQPLAPKTERPGIATTDTYASGSTCEIGGFVRPTAGKSYWFSEIYYHFDFQTLSIELDSKKKNPSVPLQPSLRLHSYTWQQDFSLPIAYLFT